MELEIVSVRLEANAVRTVGNDIDANITGVNVS